MTFRVNAMMKASFVSVLLILLVFAAHVLPSFGEGQIHVSGIDPSSASANNSARVYGTLATPNSVVTAMLGTSLSLNQPFIVGNGTSPLIILGSNNLLLGSTLASGSGDWSISFVTPNVLPGYYNVYVFDNASQTSDTISFLIPINISSVILGPLNVTIYSSNMTGLPAGSLLFYVNGTAVPSSGPPGASVTMSGRYASGGELDVYFDNSLVATVVGQHGDWSTSFQVPNVLTGNHTIRALDIGGNSMKRLDEREIA